MFFTYGRVDGLPAKKTPDRMLIFLMFHIELFFFRNGFKTKKTAPQRFETFERSDRYKKQPRCTPRVFFFGGGVL